MRHIKSKLAKLMMLMLVLDSNPEIRIMLQQVRRRIQKTQP